MITINRHIRDHKPQKAQEIQSKKNQSTTNKAKTI